MPGIRPAPGEIPQKAMAYILQGLCTISYGEMVLVAQDGVLMQVEWSEKRRLDCWHDTEDAKPPYPERVLTELAARIRKEFRLLQYGRLVLVIRKGRLMQIERTENSASPALTARASDSRCPAAAEKRCFFVAGCIQRSSCFSLVSQRDVRSFLLSRVGPDRCPR